MSLISLFRRPPLPHLRRVRGQWYADGGGGVPAHLLVKAIDWCAEHSELKTCSLHQDGDGCGHGSRCPATPETGCPLPHWRDAAG